VPQDTKNARLFWEGWGKLRGILLEDGGTNVKAATGGAVQRKRGRTKRSERKHTKSVRPFNRENTESKREEPYVTDLVWDQRDEGLGVVGREEASRRER